MARSDVRLRVKRRLQGVAFLAVVAALLGFTIAIYNHSMWWQSTDRLTLQAERIGNQLVVPADVKLDGILVGRVSDVQSDGTHATLTLQIDKSQLPRIPANVEARILPKTLFGEKFVDLVVPPGTQVDASHHIQPGAVILEDHSQTAIELQTVFNHLVPLLRTLQPAELSVALSNLASAVRNRGDALGHNLELVNQYFSTFNKDLPNFEHDISALADMASNYADAAPDLLAMLRNFSVNAHTITVKQDTYAQFLTGTSAFARTAATVFGDNANRLIELANVSRPVADLYAHYSTVLECLPNGLAIYDRTRLEQTFNQGPYLHITLTPVGDRGPYTKSDAPRTSDFTDMVLPPNCYGLPYGNHDLHPIYARFPGPHPTDNYQCGGYTAPPSCPAAPPSAPSSTPTSVNGPGSKAEQQFIARLLGPLFGRSTVSNSAAGLSDLLVGPMLRGMAVSVS